MERPAQLVVKPFGGRFADVVEQSCPTEPFIVAAGCHIVDYLKRVQEIVLVTHAFDSLNPLQVQNGREGYGQQTRAVEQLETCRRARRTHDLAQLVVDALACYDLQSRGVAAYRLKRFRQDLEIELRGKPHSAHHAQRIVRECDVGVERRADHTLGQVDKPVERVNQFAEPVGVQADGHGVDGEIPAVLVVGQRAVLHYRIAALPAV